MKAFIYFIVNKNTNKRYIGHLNIINKGRNCEV